MQESSVNAIQAGILRRLYRHDSMRFAELNADNVPSDQFSYHLRQLVKWGLLDKTEDNRYSLSNYGKRRVLLLARGKNSFIEQGFVAVRVVLSKMQDGQEYFLLQERRAVPYRGTYGTPGDKIMFGEDVSQTAARALLDQTGLTCDMELRCVRHIKEEYQGELMQDKYFFIFWATNPRGDLPPSGPAGKNVWMTLAELEASGKSIQGGIEILEAAKSSTLQFKEVTYQVTSY